MVVLKKIKNDLKTVKNNMSSREKDYKGTFTESMKSSLVSESNVARCVKPGDGTKKKKKKKGNSKRLQFNLIYNISCP